jgi:cellulose biosynthesis protein BcsQ
MDRSNGFLADLYCHNESEVKSKFLASFLFIELGFHPRMWFQEVSYDSYRVDFLVFPFSQPGKRIDRTIWQKAIVFEAKHPRDNLDLHIFKLRNYLKKFRIGWGIITNSRQTRLYEYAGNDFRLLWQSDTTEIFHRLPALRSLLSPLLGKAHLPPRTKIDSYSQNIGNIEPLTLPHFPVSQEILHHLSTSTNPMKTIAVYHNKGGVGKTTTVINLAAALSKQNYRILVIDLDSQANTTFATGLVKFDDDDGDNIRSSYILQLLQSEDDYSVEMVTRRSDFCNPPIDVIPAHIDLMQAESDLNNREFTRLILRDKLVAECDRYDIVLIDTPPSLNLFARIALIAADYLAIPSDLKPFANQGLQNVKKFVKTIDSFRRQLNGVPPIEILGVIPSKISTNARFVQYTLPDRIKKITDRYELPIFDSTIYERDDLAKCSELTTFVGEVEIATPKSVIDYKPNCTSALEFELLASEIAAKIGLPATKA